MFLEEQVQNLRRRIKNIEQNPRPEYLKSNKLKYEIELEQCLHVIDAWKEGRPFACMYGVEALIQPLGFAEQGYVEWGDRVRDPQRYYNLAVNKFGFPEHACDRTMTALGLFVSGEVPLPRLMTSRRIPCDPERWSSMAAAKYAGVLFFDVNRLSGCDDDNIHYVGEQLAELVEFAEKSVPGIHYDEEKLVQLLEMDQEALEYCRDTYELRKKMPCPISPQDSFRLWRPPSRYPNPDKVVEWSKMYHDELFERAEKGIGGVPEEKLRIAWLCTGPYGRSTFDLLTRKGVSLPWFQYGMAPHWFGLVRSDYASVDTNGKRFKPLEEMARRFNTNVWGGTSEPWVDTLIQACRDLKIDAVVDFLQVGCIVTKNLKRITAQRLRDELDIPTLDLEGREFFATEASQAEMNRKLEEFLDMCIARKNG